MESWSSLELFRWDAALREHPDLQGDSRVPVLLAWILARIDTYLSGKSVDARGYMYWDPKALEAAEIDEDKARAAALVGIS